MTLSSVSIPFRTRTQTGCFNLNVIEHEGFLNLVSRTSSAAETALKRLKTCPRRMVFNTSNKESLFVFPRPVTFNLLQETITNGSLVIVKHAECLYIGFSPIPEEDTKLTQHNRFLRHFHHYQLDSIPKEHLERMGISEKGKSLLQLPLDTKLETISGKATFKKLYLMLLSDHKNNALALLCCKNPIPSALPVPTLCLKAQNLLSFQSESFSHIKVPCLTDRTCSDVIISCLSAEKFKQKMHESIPFKESFVEGKGYTHRVQALYWENNSLIVLPRGCSIGPHHSLSGGQLYLINGNQLEIGFIPDNIQKTTDRDRFGEFHRSLLEEVEVTNKFIHGNRCLRLGLGTEAKVCSQQNSSPCINGVSLFLLASKYTDFIALLCKTGDYDFMSIDPMNPTAGFFPLSAMGLTPPEQEPPRKKLRKEDEPGTSSTEAVKVQQIEEQAGTSAQALAEEKKRKQDLSAFT
ncbi:hypothetical protein [Candidatus Similichlamydia laticola]|uniref:Uncharacterized protein n=1 Tax=Candidatus Similichlamydia laticola TaxID=2170265 RepID=A0A369KAI3_9BACT|nr:hypothetical protein [Candidatus Similichlamydia laticola]RDB31611.1 hypothetical protein HAT2_00282 [Candidatus Similichlamydia laticola]